MTRYETLDEDFDQLARPDRDNYYASVLWSEIVSGLWQGGTDDLDVVDHPRVGGRKATAFITPKDFDTVITLYAWAQPVDWFVKEVRYGFWDAHPDLMDVEQILDVAFFAYQEWKAGRKVLVRCQAGLNRSGIITALVLMLDGMEADDAIRLMRKNRCGAVLCNRDFEQWLRDFPIEEFRDEISSAA